MFGSARSDIPAKSRGVEAFRQILREAIFTGRFQPGAPLRFHEMQALCGMSVSPVREALTRLVTEGLVETEHNRGYRVALLSRRDLDDLVRTRACRSKAGRSNVPSRSATRCGKRGSCPAFTC